MQILAENAMRCAPSSKPPTTPTCLAAHDRHLTQPGRREVPVHRAGVGQALPIDAESADARAALPGRHPPLPGLRPAARAGNLRRAAPGRERGRGLSEAALARRLGLDPGTVAAWERGEVRRPYPRIRRVFEHWLSPARVGWRALCDLRLACALRS